MENKNNTNIDKETADFVDRKISGVVEAIRIFFKLAVEDMRTFILVLSIIANIYLTHKLIDNNEKMSKVIIEEVRKQVPMEVKREALEQLQPVKDKVDTLYIESREFFKEKK